MGDFQLGPDAGRFGTYLRQLRESAKLSLDAVEEMAVGYPDRITKSHLSRIENGLAEPTFRRLYALSRIYGIPVTTLAERFEMDLKRERLKVLDELEPDRFTLRAAGQLRLEGRYLEALQVYEYLIDIRSSETAKGKDSPSDPDLVAIGLERVNCLLKLEHYRLAKEEVERILDTSDLPDDLKTMAWLLMGNACLRLGKFSVALMALEKADALARTLDDNAEVRARIANTHGNIFSHLGQLDRAAPFYEQALETYAKLSDSFEWCRTARNLAATRVVLMQLDSARELLNEVIEQAEANGYDRQLAYALSDLAVIHWHESDLDAVESYSIRSNRIARPREYLTVVFRNCFYLWNVARQRDDEASIAANERTLKAYVSKVEETIPERDEFMSYVAGGTS